MIKFKLEENIEHIVGSAEVALKCERKLTSSFGDDSCNPCY